MTTSLADDYPNEQQRLRDLLGVYKAIGPAGAFGHTMIEQCLRKADEAAMSGDVVAMVKAYAAMKECQ